MTLRCFALWRMSPGIIAEADQRLATAVRKFRLTAAKLLEPKTQHVHLTSSTPQTGKDVKEWVTKTEQNILSKLKDGPVVIS